MELLTLANGIRGVYATEERSFTTKTLKELNARDTLSEEAVRKNSTFKRDSASTVFWPTD